MKMKFGKYGSDKWPNCSYTDEIKDSYSTSGRLVILLTFPGIFEKPRKEVTIILPSYYL